MSQGCEWIFARPASFNELQVQFTTCLWDFYKLFGKILAGSRGNLESDYNDQGFAKEHFPPCTSNPWEVARRRRKKIWMNGIVCFRSRFSFVFGRIRFDVFEQRKKIARQRRTFSYRKLENRDRGKFLSGLSLCSTLNYCKLLIDYIDGLRATSGRFFEISAICEAAGLDTGGWQGRKGLLSSKATDPSIKDGFNHKNHNKDRKTKGELKFHRSTRVPRLEVSLFSEGIRF